MRNSLFAALLFISLAPRAAAQFTVPDAMWPETNHDFGTVPRGAQLLYRIPWHNSEKQKIEINDLRVSCGCTTVTPHPRALEPGQDGYLEVAMDARAFNGPKTVFIQLVTTPGPKPATIQIQARSRQDLVFNPGQFRFGSAPAGTVVTQVLEIEYAGDLAFKIEGIDKTPEHLEAKVEESYRRPGQVGYKLTATLKDTAPPGDYKEQILLKTNDPSEPIIAAVVEATLRPAVAIVPNPVNFGSTKVGKMVSRRVTLRYEKPFQVLRIEGGACVSPIFTPSATNVQAILLQWTPTESGPMQQEITIITDLPSAHELKLTLTGTVK